MWLIDQEEFLRGPDEGPDISAILKELRTANSTRNLTFVVGNGLSRAAVFEARELGKADRMAVSWDEAVDRVYRTMFKKTTFAKVQANNLVVGQAVCDSDRNGKKHVLDKIRGGMKEVPPSCLHRMISKLNPRYIVTTNQGEHHSAQH